MTAVDVMRMIQSSDVVACSALLKLFRAGQDEDEQETGSVVRTNGRGFSSVDSSFLTSLAKQIEGNREKKAAGIECYASDLSPRQIAAWRKVAPKYSRQLTGLANGADPATYQIPKEETVPQPEPDDICDDNPTDEVEEYLTQTEETPLQFARTTEDPQAARVERARTEGPSYKWTRNADGTVSVETPSGGRYTVTRTDCTCPDFANVGGEGILCKHILAQPEDVPAEPVLTGEAYRRHLCTLSAGSQAEAVALVIKISNALQGNETDRSLMNHLCRMIRRASVEDETHAAHLRIFEQMEAEDRTPAPTEKPSRRSRVKVAA